ncbi:hypothetical protein DNK44_25915 [Pseudomonas dryadis]|uniref:Uncharacterized protein n=1 Tax=Phytopseudomonas dryadis TaxID=2487520 RepID=A0A4Q9QPN3_9GAMM|nr:hypothetical protein DNK44_25915 [Pseudomonas dryadis]
MRYDGQKYQESDCSLISLAIEPTCKYPECLTYWTWYGIAINNTNNPQRCENVTDIVAFQIPIFVY